MKLSLFGPALAVTTIMSTAAFACPNNTIEGSFVDRYNSPNDMNSTYSFVTVPEFGLQSCITSALGYTGARAHLSFVITDASNFNQIVVRGLPMQDLNGVVPNCDTTMLINLPDQSWLFNDDTHGVDPEIVINNPSAQINNGRYDVWMGAYDFDEPCRGVISVRGS